MAGLLPYALLGSGGMTAANLALVQAGNAWDGEQQMTGSDKLQTVLAALAGLTMGAGFGGVKQEMEKPQLYVAKDAEGNMRVGVVDPNDVHQRATMDVLKEVAEGRLRTREDWENHKRDGSQAAAEAQDLDELTEQLDNSEGRKYAQQVAEQLAAADRARAQATGGQVADPWGPEFDRRPGGHAAPWAAQRRPV
jgi:hypothetical protein